MNKTPVSRKLAKSMGARLDPMMLSVLSPPVVQCMSANNSNTGSNQQASNSTAGRVCRFANENARIERGAATADCFARNARTKNTHATARLVEFCARIHTSNPQTDSRMANTSGRAVTPHCHNNVELRKSKPPDAAIKVRPYCRRAFAYRIAARISTQRKVKMRPIIKSDPHDTILPKCATIHE